MLLLTLLSLLACGGKSDDTAKGADDTAKGADDTAKGAEPCGDPCTLQDAQNFAYAADLSIEVQPLEQQVDALIDWSDLAVDIQGHPLDPATDVDQVRLVMFADRTPEEIQDALAADQLQQSDVAAYVTCQPEEGTSCQLSEFGILGSTPGVDEYFIEGLGAWLLAAQSWDVQGARGLLFLEPSAASTEHEARITSDTAHLTATVDLHSAPPVVLSTSTDLTVDWSGLTKNGLGDEMQLHRIDRLELGRYDMEPDELEDQFLDLELLVGDQWEADVSGETSASFSQFEGDVEFAGIDSQSTWLLALRCSTCDNPVPRFLAVVQPEGD